MKVINFNNLKRQYLTVTLPDENQTILQVGTPTKALIDELIVLQSGLNNITEDTTAVTDDLFRVCAKVLSRNKTNKKITTEFLSEIFDFADVMLFFNSYMEFVKETITAKN